MQIKFVTLHDSIFNCFWVNQFTCFDDKAEFSHSWDFNQFGPFEDEEDVEYGMTVLRRTAKLTAEAFGDKLIEQG